MQLRLLFLFLLLICCGSASFGQESNVVKAGTDTAAINRLINTANKTLNPDSAIILFDSAYQQSIAANYVDGIKDALMRKGIKYNEKGDYEQSRNCYTQAYAWCRRSSDMQAVAWYYNNMGTTYFNEGEYARASELYFTALQELKKATGSPTRMAVNIYNNLGLINLRLNQDDKALSYYKQAEDVALKGKFDYQAAIVFLNEGEYFKNHDQPDSAITYFDKVMAIAKRIDRVDLQAGANLDIGKTFIATHQYQKAIPQLQLAISLAKDYFPYIVMDASNSLGEALRKAGRYKEAETILVATLDEMKSHKNRNNYINCYGNLIALYKASGQTGKAMDCMDSLANLKDSLMSSDKAKAINQMEMKFKTAEKDKQIAQNELLIAEQKNKIANKNVWIVSIAGSIILLSIIMVSIYVNARNKERLQAEQIKSLQQENTISILKGMVQGVEDERGRIARELHDGIGGMLSAAMMRLMSIRHEIKEITTVPAYEEAIGLMDEMGDEIRKTAHNLMPEVLLKQPLPDAIRNYCNNLQAGNSLHIDFHSFGTFDAITQKNKLNIYRIVQELLKNILQHANAQHALVQLLMNEQLLTITVEDDGKGFNNDEIKKGIGLHNLQTRVNSMYGHFTIDSEVNRGTSIYIEFDAQKLIS